MYVVYTCDEQQYSKTHSHFRSRHQHMSTCRISAYYTTNLSNTPTPPSMLVPPKGAGSGFATGATNALAKAVIDLSGFLSQLGHLAL